MGLKVVRKTHCYQNTALKTTKMDTMFSLNELYDLSKSLEVSDKEAKIINALLEAMTDWRNEVNSLEEYIRQVKKFLEIENINVNVLIAKTELLSPLRYAWELKSLTSLARALNMASKPSPDCSSLSQAILRACA